ncbi:YbhB/YbcL family Raf kinase inhibitor-like protein [uncultured Alsobacter sp.]|uniref:YbhB/YbcL family Raf kinase inhibitor-like protein n=1 Tax=uncultured Alsobacter sp. TaxID=1748258 RepID=UPI0025D6FAA4|nr:YbhB/YbcL family Raf kinase inhibitor-like protein [uncultured Alsobacter sp.]
MAFYITSPLFTNGQAIPQRFARGGENVSPPLVWSGAPPGTRSFVLLMEDAMGPWPYWAAHGITGERLPENAGAASGPLRHGVNRYGNACYDGPEPPPDEVFHPYRFRLGALRSERLDVPDAIPAFELWAAAEPHMLGECDLIGLYSRLDPTAQVR